jgi:hypothetical protein
VRHHRTISGTSFTMTATSENKPAGMKLPLGERSSHDLGVLAQYTPASSGQSESRTAKDETTRDGGENPRFQPPCCTHGLEIA